MSFRLAALKVRTDQRSTAKRELLEETGYESDTFINLGKYYVLPSETNRWVYYYLALDVVKSPIQVDVDADAIEVKGSATQSWATLSIRLRSCQLPPSNHRSAGQHTKTQRYDYSDFIRVVKLHSSTSGPLRVAAQYDGLLRAFCDAIVRVGYQLVRADSDSVVVALDIDRSENIKVIQYPELE